MGPDPRLGVWGRLPPAWTASRRRRRLAFVALLAPGTVMAVAGAQILACPPLMLAGLAWMALALLCRRLCQPLCQPRVLATAPDEPAPSPPEETDP